MTSKEKRVQVGPVKRFTKCHKRIDVFNEQREEEIRQFFIEDTKNVIDSLKRKGVINYE